MSAIASSPSALTQKTERVPPMAVNSSSSIEPRSAASPVTRVGSSLTMYGIGGHSTNGSSVEVVELLAGVVLEGIVVVTSALGAQAAIATATNIEPTRCTEPR